MEQKINVELIEIIKLKNDNNYMIVDAIILHMINNGINLDEISKMYQLERDYLKEIQDVNDINGHFKGSGYIPNSKLDKLINV